MQTPPRVIVQVPMSKDLKEKAEIVSADLGFSSLQETIRVLLNKLSKREFNLKIEETAEEVHLSKAAKKRYEKAIADIKAGRNIYKPKNKAEFFKMLHS